MKAFRTSMVVVGMATAAFLAGAVPQVAQAATTKSLKVYVQSNTNSVAVTESSCTPTICQDGAAKCYALPAHKSAGWLTVPRATVSGGNDVTVSAFNSSNCKGAATKVSPLTKVPKDNSTSFSVKLG